MNITNIILQEATEERVKLEPILAEIKKNLNTCKLSKFKSMDSCNKFYSNLFLNTIENVGELTINDWSTIYIKLLNDNTFCNNLCIFIAVYQPQRYDGLFKNLQMMIMCEYNEASKKIRFLSDVKSLLSFLQIRFDSIGNTVKAQVNDPNALKFITVIYGTLNTLIIQIDGLIRKEVESPTNQNQITYTSSEENEQPLEEDTKEFINFLESCDSWISNYEKNLLMNEAIVNTAAEKLKEINVTRKKAELAFDQLVMKKYKEMVDNRRNRKHAEIVGESLRITHEIKRLLASGIIGALNPAAGVITWIVTLMIDRKTDKKDRLQMVEMIKDELEITDEKISQAERNGDDKAKIELIRFKQKLNREYRRINKVWYNPSQNSNS